MKAVCSQLTRDAVENSICSGLEVFSVAILQVERFLTANVWATAAELYRALIHKHKINMSHLFRLNCTYCYSLFSDVHSSNHDSPAIKLTGSSTNYPTLVCC